MNLIFCGTPQFAVPTLERLIAEQFKIELVLTNPDEPAGRGYALRPSPIKQAAEKAGLQVYQPAKLKDPEVRAYLERFRPDAMVVVAYGHIIPAWMFELPRLGCINLHASLLPRYRGAAPIAWAIIRGETVTGVTTMKIEAGLDTGDVLLKRETPIGDEDTTETLSARLSEMGAGLMVETLRSLERGEITPRKQDASQATLAPILHKQDGRVDWAQPAAEVARRVRGLRPWPGAYSSFRGKRLHVWAASPVTPAPGAFASQPPGTLVASQGRLLIACGQNTLLEARELQLEGRKRISARDFLNGIHLQPGEKAE